MHETPWKKQLIVIWFTQLLSMAGFCIGLPFAAYYIQSMGVTGDDVVWWTTAFAVSAPLCFAVAAPFWGKMADRFGRKKMLLRACVCAAVVMCGMGWAPTVIWLIVFRIGQGLFTGVMPAAQTLIAVSTPGRRQGMALGSLAAATAAGVGIGSALGGRLAESYGYNVVFYVGGAISLLAALLVIIGVEERHQTTAIYEKSQHTPAHAAQSRHILLLLLAMTALVSIMTNIDLATFPLLIQELNGALEGAARIVGDINALAGIAFAIGGLIWGLCADRFGSGKILSLCTIAAVVCSVQLCYVEEIDVIYFIVLGIAFSLAGIDPILQTLISKNTPEHKRGVIFGYTATARSIGWLGGPMLGSYVAIQSDFGQVYWMRVVIACILLPLIVYVFMQLRRVGEATNSTAKAGE